MDDASAADVPLMISAVTVVELIYLVEKGTFSQANVEAFYEILDAGPHCRDEIGGQDEIGAQEWVMTGNEI
ncbi:MAG: hypothetical protein ACRDRO_01865 [Pseudonocardiaceae bacterium]